LFNLQTGEIRSFPQFQDTIIVERLAFLEDSQTAVVATFDGTLALVNLMSDKILWRAKPFSRLQGASLSPDGSVLFAQGLEGLQMSADGARVLFQGVPRAKIWRFSAGSTDAVEEGIAPIDLGTNGAIVRLELLNSHLVLVTTLAAPYGDTFLWSLTQARKTHRFTHEAGHYPLIVSPDGRLILCHEPPLEDSPKQQKFKVWDVKSSDWASPKEPKALWKWPAYTIEQGKIRFWNVATGEELRSVVAMGHVAPDAKKAVSYSRGGTISLWNLETGECVWRHEDSVK
jgi:WD40 repeat protein